MFYVKILFCDLGHILQCSIGFLLGVQAVLNIPVVPNDDPALARHVMWQNAALVDTRSLDKNSPFFLTLLYCRAGAEDVAQIPWSSSVYYPNFHSMVGHVHGLGSLICTLSVESKNLFQIH